MPWMLQPKSYTQIARPNLYNVAYRRVGAYKGMGRLHPTNYLQIGYRPNMIGATTGQYNTLSGQLSLLPPSLRGLGQAQQDDLTAALADFSKITPPVGPMGGGTMADLYQNVASQYAGSLPAPTKPTNYIPWIIGAALFVVLLTGGRR